MRPPKFIRHLLLALLMVAGFSVEAQHYVTIDGEVDTVLVLPRLGGDTAYFVNNALTVVAGGELEVEAGARIFFGQSAYLRVDGGRLRMDGTANDSIYLLCYEFSHDWAGVQLKNVSEADSLSFSYVEVVGALTALNASNCMNVNINHCTFNNYYAGKGLELVDCSDFVIDSCFFDNCVSGVELKARSSHSENNTISHSIFDKGQINVEVSNVNYGYKCHNTIISDNCFQGATTAISFESVGGLSDMDAVNYILNNVISSDLPEGGSSYTSYGIKAAMDSLVIRNNIFWSNDEAITMLRVCHLIIDGNTFYDNNLLMTNLLASGSATFTRNVISEAKKRIINFPSDLSSMNGNNFLKYNTSTTLFANVSLEDIDMRGNYWDTTNPDVIEGVLLHKPESPALGEIHYEGYLSECATDAPVAPPFKVKKQFVNGQWLISWDANQEPDFNHYVLFYGEFEHYKFSKHTDSIFDTQYYLSSQLAENVAVAGCDHHYDFDVYATAGQSAYAFATYYPYAGADADLCAQQSGFTIEDANIPYTYNRFVWRTSGTGVFSDSLSLRPVYYPSEEDYALGEVTLTLRVTSLDETKTDAMRLGLHQQMEVFAGPDSYGGLDHPVVLSEAWVDNYDSITWYTLGDGHFDDPHLLTPTYFLGEQDKLLRSVDLVLEAWSFCGHAFDTVHYDFYEEFSMAGMIWAEGMPFANAQVLAVALSDDNPFFSGFYRTVSDAEGRFAFNSLLPDTYILYAFPDTLDLIHAGVYYLGDYQWNESNMIVVDGDVYDVDVVLPSRQQGFALGTGSVGGVFDYPEMEFRAGAFYCVSWLRESGDVEYCNGGLSNVGVLLLDAAKQRILGFALTNERGRFHFNGLPFGTYHVMADVPRYGRGMCEEITLSPDQPTMENLHLYIDGRGRVAMRQNEPVSEEAPLALFPNPVEGMMTLCGLQSLVNYKVIVTDMLGNIVMIVDVKADLLGECQMELNDLSRGIYFMTVTGAEGSQALKFVKK
jgi:hypothetical protein